MCGGLKMIHILNEDFNSEQIAELISICKSDSGSMGTKLRNAHYELGKGWYKITKIFFQVNAV